MTRDFWVHIPPPRSADFEHIFGTSIVPVTSPVAAPAGLPGFTEPELVYLLDLGWVAEMGCRDRLVAHLAGRFGIPEADVDRDLEQVGMPIREEGTTLQINRAERWT